MFILFFFARCFFSPYMVTVNCLSTTAAQRRSCAEKCFFLSLNPTVNLFVLSVQSLCISTCVCLFPALVSCWKPSEHTHIRTSCTQTRSALDPRRSSVIWQPHIFSLFLVHFQAPPASFPSDTPSVTSSCLHSSSAFFPVPFKSTIPLYT